MPGLATQSITVRTVRDIWSCANRTGQGKLSAWAAEGNHCNSRDFDYERGMGLGPGGWGQMASPPMSQRHRVLVWVHG
jgi:hypothetical protein